MKIIMTSSLGGSFKVNGVRVPSVFLKDNGLLDKIRESCRKFQGNDYLCFAG